MLQELIFALNGYSGDLFVHTGYKFELKLKENIKLPYVHPSELEIIQNLLQIATLYVELKQFVQKRRFISFAAKTDQDNAQIVTGEYIASIANGIDIILKDYVQDLCKIEWLILNEPNFTLDHIKSRCEPYRDLFNTLKLFINMVSEEISSCLLVDTFKNIYDENIHLQQHLIPLVKELNFCLRKHITHWVLFGKLPHQPKEFFIQLKNSEIQQNSSAPTPSTSNTSIFSSTSNLKYFNPNEPTHFINFSIVPAYFSIQLSDTILFIGNSTLILSKAEKTKDSLALLQEEFTEKMKDLPLDSFRTDALVETLESLSLQVGKKLYDLVTIDADLLLYLRIIKDCYLGGRGELLHDFLSNLSSKISEKTVLIDRNSGVAKNTKIDVKECFYVAARRIQLQDEILEKLEIQVIPDAMKKTNMIEKYLNGLKLNLKLEWPLHILFSSESMEFYNDLFRFLLRIRHLQIEFKTIWLETKKIFRIPIPGGPAMLCIEMTYFFNNLQHYLQADVLESQFEKLLQAYNQSETFNQIKVALAKFQANIMVQSFRTNTTLREGLDEMITVCGQYCEHLKYNLQQFAKNGIPVCEGETKEISEFARQFHRRVEHLYVSFRRLVGDPQFSIYLKQLILRLDYNFYFTKHIQHHISTEEVTTQ